MGEPTNDIFTGIIILWYSYRRIYAETYLGFWHNDIFIIPSRKICEHIILYIKKTNLFFIY